VVAVSTDRVTQRCAHVPRCPSAAAPDHAAARVVGGYLQQGWSLLCNGVVVFDDGGEILPDRAIVAARYPGAAVPLRAA
jgi:hypothetical protein